MDKPECKYKFWIKKVSLIAQFYLWKSKEAFEDWVSLNLVKILEENTIWWKVQVKEKHEFRSFTTSTAWVAAKNYKHPGILKHCCE